MNKLIKAILIILITLMILGVIFYIIDRKRILNNKFPIFCIDQSGGSIINYIGLGYCILGAYDDIPGGLPNAKVYTWIGYIIKIY